MPPAFFGFRDNETVPSELRLHLCAIGFDTSPRSAYRSYLRTVATNRDVDKAPQQYPRIGARRDKTSAHWDCTYILITCVSCVKDLFG